MNHGDLARDSRLFRAGVCKVAFPRWPGALRRWPVVQVQPTAAQVTRFLGTVVCVSSHCLWRLSRRHSGAEPCLRDRMSCENYGVLCLALDRKTKQKTPCLGPGGLQGGGGGSRSVSSVMGPVWALSTDPARSYSRAPSGDSRGEGQRTEKLMFGWRLLCFAPS